MWMHTDPTEMKGETPFCFVFFLNLPSNASRVSRPSDLGPNGSSRSQLRVVEFASRSDMKNAISKLDGTELNGRKLKIFEDSRK